MNHDKRIMDAVESAAAKQATANASLAAIEAAELTGLLVWATGTDAAANPDAGAYTAAAACRMRIARCDTNSALVSLDDGVTWLHLALANYSGEQWYAVPAGSKVKAKNAVAGSNFANLSIEIGAV